MGNDLLIKSDTTFTEQLYSNFTTLEYVPEVQASDMRTSQPSREEVSAKRQHSR